MSDKRVPIFDSGFNRVATMSFNGEAVLISFDKETIYKSGDSICLGITQLKALIGGEKTDEQSAQNN